LFKLFCRRRATLSPASILIEEAPVTDGEGVDDAIPWTLKRINSIYVNWIKTKKNHRFDGTVVSNTKRHYIFTS
jgi:hypothetical protein